MKQGSRQKAPRLSLRTDTSHIFPALLRGQKGYTDSMKKPGVVFVFVIFLALSLGLGLWLWSSVPGWIGLASVTKSYNTATVLKQVQTLSQLVTVKYVMEKVVVLEDVKWFGENRVLLVAHGIVKAGVDFGQLKPEDVKVSGTNITIRMPPAQIMDTYLDEHQTRIIERTTGLLRMFDKDLEQTARQRAVDDIRRSARTAGILKDADERARAQVKNLFQQVGLEVEFRPQ